MNTPRSRYEKGPRCGPFFWCAGSLNAVYTNTALTLTPGVYCSEAVVGGPGRKRPGVYATYGASPTSAIQARSSV